MRSNFVNYHILLLVSRLAATTTSPTHQLLSKHQHFRVLPLMRLGAGSLQSTVQRDIQELLNAPAETKEPKTAPFDGVGQPLTAAHKSADVQRLVLLQECLKLRQLHVPGARYKPVTNHYTCQRYVEQSVSESETPSLPTCKTKAARHWLGARSTTNGIRMK